MPLFLLLRSQTNALFLAANHRYRLIFAVGPRGRHGLRAAARRTDNGWRRRYRGANDGRTSMDPISRNIIGACKTDVVRPIHIYVESAKRSPATGPAKCLVCCKGKRYVERQDQRHTDLTLHGTRTNSQVKELTGGIVGILVPAVCARQRKVNH
jgi:hypothetical protein